MTKKKIDLNRLILITSLMYAALTLMLLISEKVIEKKYVAHVEIKRGLINFTLALYAVICLFLVAVSMKASLMMN